MITTARFTFSGDSLIITDCRTYDDEMELNRMKRLYPKPINTNQIMLKAEW